MKNTAQQFSGQKRDKKTKENKGGKVQTLIIGAKRKLIVEERGVEVGWNRGESKSVER